MLQELTAETGAGLWATGSLLFFIAVYAFVTIRLMRTSTSELEQHARLALEDEADGQGSRSGS
jgi:hypothetical protein